MKKILTLLLTTTVISVGMMDMARACRVEYEALFCENFVDFHGYWQCDTATATCTDSSNGRTVSYDSSTGNATVDRNGSTTTTYDATTGNITSSTEIDSKGNHKTTTYEYGRSTGISYTDSDGNNLTGVYKDGDYTYNISDDGTVTDYRYDYSSDCYQTGPDRKCQKGGISRTYDATGNQTSSTQTDPDGNQRVEVNGQTTYLDSDGNALTGTFKDGYYTYNCDDGTRTSSDYKNSCWRKHNGVCYARKEHSEYGENGRKTVYSINGDCIQVIKGACVGRSDEYEYDSSGYQTSSMECSYTGNISEQKCTGRQKYCNNEGVCQWIDGTFTKDAENGLKYICTNSNSCEIFSGTNKVGNISCTDKTNCLTQFYDADGNVIAEYDDNGKPVNAYDYADDGSTLVYDDQCRVKERLDPYGNSIYDFGDTLLSENRRTRYTPAEAAEIVGNSEDNMIVMYFK